MEERGQAQATLKPGLWPVGRTSPPKSKPDNIIPKALGSGTNDKVTDTGSAVIAFICSVDAEVKGGSVFFKGILKQHLYEELQSIVILEKNGFFFSNNPIPPKYEKLPGSASEFPHCSIDW